MNNNENVGRKIRIDCFAGGGGASQGARDALHKEITIAINHDPAAILMHKTNHPDTLHLTEDIFQVDLRKHLKENDEVEFMWGSPDCFPAGNLVWTDCGYKRIEDIRCNDFVLTHKGNYRKVYRTIKKNDRKFCNIKIAGCEMFQATLNHPFYARKKKVYSIHGEHRTVKTKLLEPEWVRAEDLTKEYRVGIPINTESIIPEWNGTVKYKCNQYGVTSSEVENNITQYLHNLDFWWLIGRYIGDGSVSMDKSIIDLCCSYNEINEIRCVVERLGIKFTTRKKEHTYSFMFSSKELCEFVAQFGLGSCNKKITPVILNLPIDLLKGFLEGYLSADGCYHDKVPNSRWSFCTISKELAYGLQQCLLKAYRRYAGMTKSSNRDIIQGRKVNAKDIYTLVFYELESNRLQYCIEDNIAWVNVKECNIVKDEQKSIYTLSVDEDESFTINNISVHNCTSHSKAKGGQPRERGLRVLPWSIYRLCLQIFEITGKKPKILFMENVEEIQKWCPLDENGRPIKELLGCCYQCFIEHMTEGGFHDDGRPLDCLDMCNEHCNNCLVTKEKYNKALGFDMGSKELVAADYGAPTTRKRWYAIFRSDKQPVVFPEPTHSKDEEDGKPPWVPVSKIIDWTDLGKSIFTRKKPLAEATQNRIARGIKKYIVDNSSPFFVPEKEATAFLIQYHGEQKEGDSRGQRLDEPIKTIDTSNRYGLVTAFITKFYKTRVGQGCDEPLHTITTSPGHFGLVSAFLVKYYGQGVGQKIDQPLGTIVTKDRFGLVNVVFTIAGEQYIIKDILFRMLNPEELKLAQGFPESYIIDRDYTGKKYPIKERVARIGNSVVPIMDQALIEANCQDLIEIQFK